MFGSHLSIAGGMQNALLEAETLGMDTVQVFTKNQQQWRAAPLAKEAVDQWTIHRDRLRFKQTVSHDSYLINLASPDDKLWNASIDLFMQELRRCVALGIPYLVAHPGAHVGSGEEAGLTRIAAALDKAHAAVSDKSVTTCLEITAGQGTSLGYRLEHLATLLSLAKTSSQMGVCLDTAHLFAAGYDFRGKKYADLRKQIEDTVGLERIKVWHLNDSKKDLGSRVDRHDHIGKGFIGLEGFRPIVRDGHFTKTPKILETPKEKAPDGRPWDTVNLETLKSLL